MLHRSINQVEPGRYPKPVTAHNKATLVDFSQRLLARAGYLDVNVAVGLQAGNQRLGGFGAHTVAW